MTIGFIPLPWAPGLGVLAALLLLGVFSVAPASIVQFRLIGSLAPEGMMTEAFTWLLSASLAGTAVGNALGGSAVEICGARGALLAPIALTALAFVLSFIGGLAAALLRPQPDQGNIKSTAHDLEVPPTGIGEDLTISMPANSHVKLPVSQGGQASGTG